jgi:hypothetical protein
MNNECQNTEREAIVTIATCSSHFSALMAFIQIHSDAAEFKISIYPLTRIIMKQHGYTWPGSET